MDVQQAIDVINRDMVYKPGWSFLAEDHTGRFETGVRVRIVYPAPNSDRDEAMQGYPTIVTPHVAVTLMVGTYNTADLLRHVLAAVMEIEEHEAREFLRLRSLDFDAPFHPHRFDGIMRWEMTSTPDQDAIERAVRFGVA